MLQVALHDQVGGCQNFWRAKPEYVQQYDLATVIPQDVQEVLAVARARQRPKRGGTLSALTLCMQTSCTHAICSSGWTQNSCRRTQHLLVVWAC